MDPNVPNDGVTPVMALADVLDILTANYGTDKQRYQDLVDGDSCGTEDNPMPTVDGME